MYRWLTRGLILGLGYLLVVPAGVVLARQSMAQVPESQETNEAIILIRGLDGATYMPYSPVVVKKVQEALKAQGLYEGEMNGVLDEAAMKAIGDFQQKHNLTLSGVPTPETRKLLLNEFGSES